ncbi:hypothetical protein ACFXPR_35850 [Nocardia tengchongensis]|uniref:hypothetical protein n=1 Tax=Nocardia tengchongensis TaxID=2055889 RepID=UPI00367EA1D1
MDDEERLQILAKVADQLDELVAFAKTELALNVDPGAQDFLAEAQPQLERMSDYSRDVLTLRAVLDALRLHGPGPWIVGELAALTGRDSASVDRVLRKLSENGRDHFV